MSAEVPLRNSLLIDGIRVAGKLGSGTSPPWGVPNMSPPCLSDRSSPETPVLAPPGLTGTQLWVEGICQLRVELKFCGDFPRASLPTPPRVALTVFFAAVRYLDNQATKRVKK